MISSVGLFYFFESLIFAGVSFKLFKTYKKTANSITKNFVLLFSFLTLTFLCWSIPSLIFPESNFLLNIGSLLGEAFIFIGFAFGMRSFVALRFPDFPQNLVSLGTILMGAVIVYLNATVFGSSQLSPQGVIEWNLNPIAVFIYAVLIVLLTIPLGIEFLRRAIIMPETRLRSLLLAFGSILTGPGGILVISNVPADILMSGHILLSLGVVLIGWGFFFTEKP